MVGNPKPNVWPRTDILEGRKRKSSLDQEKNQSAFLSEAQSILSFRPGLLCPIFPNGTHLQGLRSGKEVLPAGQAMQGGVFLQNV